MEEIEYKKSYFKKLNKTLEKDTKEKIKKERVKPPYKPRFMFFGTVMMALAFVTALGIGVFAGVQGIQKASLGHVTSEAYKKETIPLSKALTMHEDATYYVYIYKSDCSGCSSIEKTVLKYLKSGPRPLYLINGDKYEYSLIEFDSSGSAISKYDVSDYKDLRVPQFPCLLLVQNGEVIGHNIGQTSIYNQLTMR